MVKRRSTILHEEKISAEVKRLFASRTEALIILNKVWPVKNRRIARDYASSFLSLHLGGEPPMPVSDLYKLAAKEDPPISQVTLRRAFKEHQGIAFRKRRHKPKSKYPMFGSTRNKTEVHWKLPDDRKDGQWLLEYLGDKRIHISALITAAKSRGITRGRLQRLAKENNIDTSDFKWRRA